MRVTVYAALAHGGSWAGWSVAPEVDFAYWLGSGYREAVEEVARGWSGVGRVERGGEIERGSNGRKDAGAAGEAGRRKEVAAIIAWSAPIPLGHAEQVVERWSGKARDEQGVREELTRLVREAWASDVRLGLPVQEREDAHAVKAVVSGDVASGGAADAKALAARACRAASLLQGRALLSSEALALLGAAGAAEPAGAAAWSAAAPALQLAALLGRLRLGGAVAPQPQPRLLRWRAALGARPRPRLRCQRCGSGTARMRRTACARCGRACAYCEACLTMGRSRECGLLITGTPFERFKRLDSTVARTGNLTELLAGWNLSPAQEAAAGDALGCILPALKGTTLQESVKRRSPCRFLLWAVTGAGKTEMIFPLVSACLRYGGRALIATPRRDVVLELDPRIRRAFPQHEVVTLYGGSEQRWAEGDITLATTHQLFRLNQAFHLVIIDELDAFPYHNDPMLHYAAEKVGIPGGATVLLTATPPAELRRAARFGRLAHVRVPARFHRHPLPVPVHIQIPSVRHLLRRPSIPQKLIRALHASIERGAQLFLFVTSIRDIDPLVSKLRRAFPHVSVDGTSSKDDGRTEKVQQFRNRTIKLLVTTTILERGVTIPCSDVFILDADSQMYDEASLVQMSGRAGRSADDPYGRVYFCAAARTVAQRGAIRQIRTMNRIAKRRGYLISN